MALATLTGSALYTGPNSTDYAVAATGVSGKRVTVLWKERTYYYVRLTTPKVQGYISIQNIDLDDPNADIDVKAPLITRNWRRYISSNSSTYLGINTTYKTIATPEKGQAVYYLDEKEGNFAFIEYETAFSTKKYRGWFPHMSLSIDPPSRFSPEQYIHKIETLVDPNDYARNEETGATYCNLYAFDAMEKCDADLPTKSDGVTAGNCQEMYNKLITNQFTKWRMVEYAEAQHRANFGIPTIALEPSHVAVVRPNGGSTPSSKKDVHITQAGARVLVNQTLNWGWSVGSAGYNAIQFFTWLY